MYFEKFRLDGQTAVVTGGGRGIGLACAEALAEAGARLVVIDRDEALAASGAAALSARGFAAETLVLDVTDSAAVENAAADIFARHGRIDILVANAGIARTGTAAEDVPDELWLNVNDVNYNGVFWCDRAFGRLLPGAVDEKRLGRDGAVAERFDLFLHDVPSKGGMTRKSASSSQAVLTLPVRCRAGRRHRHRRPAGEGRRRGR